jgi:hypothetical protein
MPPLKLFGYSQQSPLPIFTKLGMYIMPPEAISTVYFTIKTMKTLKLLIILILLECLNRSSWNLVCISCHLWSYLNGVVHKSHPSVMPTLQPLKLYGFIDYITKVSFFLTCTISGQRTKSTVPPHCKKLEKTTTTTTTTKYCLLTTVCFVGLGWCSYSLAASKEFVMHINILLWGKSFYIAMDLASWGLILPVCRWAFKSLHFSGPCFARSHLSRPQMSNEESTFQWTLLREVSTFLSTDERWGVCMSVDLAS